MGTIEYKELFRWNLLNYYKVKFYIYC
jgi:hypothetical protein